MERESQFLADTGVFVASPIRRITMVSTCDFSLAVAVSPFPRRPFSLHLGFPELPWKLPALSDVGGPVAARNPHGERAVFFGSSRTLPSGDTICDGLEPSRYSFPCGGFSFAISSGIISDQSFD